MVILAKEIAKEMWTIPRKILHYITTTKGTQLPKTVKTQLY